MGVSGCAKCVKYLLLVLNFVFFIAGSAMVGVGIWIVIDYDSFAAVLDNPFLKSAVYLLIGVGGVVAIIGFLGCCGAAKEVKGFLIAYIVILLIIVLAEGALVAVVFYFGSATVEEVIVDAANKTLVKYGSVTAITDSWDTVQILSSCCGLYGYSDFAYTAWFNASGHEFPESCCKVESIDAGTYVNVAECREFNTTYYNARGCVTYLKEVIDENLYIAAGVVIGIVALEILGIVCGIWLCCSIKKD